MNLDALTQIPLADLGMGVIVLVLAIWVSRYARSHGVSLDMDTPTHQFVDDLRQSPMYRAVPGNASHSDND